MSSATVACLGGIAALHVAWACGSSFPFSTRAELADTVVGGDVVPGSAESFAVAGLLTVAAGLVADALPVPAPLRRVGVVGVATVLTVRGAFGFAGRTGLLVPGSDSPRFVKRDRRLYAPLCLALACGALTAIKA